MLTLLLLACTPSLPPAYSAEIQNADRSYRAGQYEAAAEHWEQARQLAPGARERDECTYRRATSLERAGKIDEARAVLLTLQQGEPGERQARAAFDRARLLIDAGDEQRGYAELDAAIRKFPNSGLAPKAVRDIRQDDEAKLGGEAALQHLAKLASAVGGSDLAEVLAYEQALLIDSTRGAGAALGPYRALITRYPYPTGLYWDESILRVAAIERELGQPKRAIEWLKWMISHREESNFMGSYERHYSKARFLMAEIWRDDLNDWQRAREEFRALVQDYPTSLLRDDALFEAARLSNAHGDATEACSDVAKLEREFPDSRHAHEAEALCPR